MGTAMHEATEGAICGAHARTLASAYHPPLRLRR